MRKLFSVPFIVLQGVCLALILAMGACSSTQVSKVVTQGQLYCAKATAAGPVVVALATVAGGPVNVIGQAKSYVDAACAVIGGFAVSPPANEAAAPTLTIPSVTVPLQK